MNDAQKRARTVYGHFPLPRAAGGHKVLLSIGLNVGESEPVSQLSDTLAAVAGRAVVLGVAMGASVWQGTPERFVQILAEVRGRPAAFAAALARELSQDAIGVLGLNVGHIGAVRWVLIDAAGTSSAGGTLAEFPALLEVPA